MEFGVHPSELTEHLEAEIQEDLLRFFGMFKFYNPNLPMGQGMAAEFIMRRESIEHKLRLIAK